MVYYSSPKAVVIGPSCITSALQLRHQPTWCTRQRSVLPLLSCRNVCCLLLFQTLPGMLCKDLES